MPTSGIWFASSGRTFKGFPGFLSRRLLTRGDGGTYAAIVEFADRASFQAMHSSPAHADAGERVSPLFDGKPTPVFYEVIDE